MIVLFGMYYHHRQVVGIGDFKELARSYVYPRISNLKTILCRMEKFTTVKKLRFGMYIFSEI
jgi:hypothetical protein